MAAEHVVTISKHFWKRTATTRARSIRRLQKLARQSNLPNEPGLELAERDVRVDDDIRVERAARGPLLWRVAAYRPAE